MAKAIFGLSIGCYLIMIVMRYYTTYKNQNEIQKIKMKLNRNFTIQEIQLDNIKWYFEFFQRYTRIYSMIQSSSMFFFCFDPAQTLIIKGERIFPFIVKFPFDATQIIFYPFIMLWLFFCHLTHVLAIVANEVLLYGIITILSMEFKLLRVEIEKLVEKKGENIKIQIRNVIKRHQELLAISSNIEEIFSPSFFCNFILSSIVISFTAIRASIASDPVEIIFCALFCSVAFTQISLQCFFGHLLKECSDEIAPAIFNCDWKNFSSINEKKNLLFFLMRSQKSPVLTALKFSEINMEQLTGILTRTYSYFTLCRSFLLD